MKVQDQEITAESALCLEDRNLLTVLRNVSHQKAIRYNEGTPVSFESTLSKLVAQIKD